MKTFKNILHKIIFHPETPSLVLICTMVAIMASYNTIIRYGLSEKIFLKILIAYPFIVLIVHLLKTYVTLPIVLKLHAFFPKLFKINVPVQITIPLSVIFLNISIIMILFTELHRDMYPQFLIGYISNWAKTFFVAVPVFFFIVRPLILGLFDLIKAKYPLNDVFEANKAEQKAE